MVTFQSGELPSAVLRGFTLQNGLEANGGGIYCTGGSSPSLYDLIITNNSANGGAGVHCFSGSSPRLENIKIINNSATGNNGRGGGLRCTTNSDPTLVNVLISDNTATQEGGGVFCYNSDPSFVNVTITGNLSSIADGGGMFIKSNSGVNLLNTIIGGNESNEIEFSSVDDSSTITISYSNIAGGQDSIITNDNGTVIWGDGSIDVDPMFVDTANGNYHLLASSQCINGGDPTTFDSDGSRADMGAYPYLNSYSGPTWYVETAGNDTTGTGSSGSPFASVQAGLNFAGDNQTINVSNGTYYENVVWPNYTYKMGVQLLGEDRETTIIDGGANGSVMHFELVDTTSYMNGFTIQNGMANQGGGLYISSSGMSFENLIIKENHSENSGGAMYLTGIAGASTHANMNNIIISDNVANEGSASYQSAYSTLSLNNSIVENNQYIGGICSYDAY